MALLFLMKQKQSRFMHILSLYGSQAILCGWQSRTVFLCFLITSIRDAIIYVHVLACVFRLFIFQVFLHPLLVLRAGVNQTFLSHVVEL